MSIIEKSYSPQIINPREGTRSPRRPAVLSEQKHPIPPCKPTVRGIHPRLGVKVSYRSHTNKRP